MREDRTAAAGGITCGCCDICPAAELQSSGARDRSIATTLARNYPGPSLPAAPCSVALRLCFGGNECEKKGYCFWIVLHAQLTRTNRSLKRFLKEICRLPFGIRKFSDHIRQRERTTDSVPNLVQNEQQCRNRRKGPNKKAISFEIVSSLRGVRSQVNSALTKGTIRLSIIERFDT